MYQSLSVLFIYQKGDLTYLTYLIIHVTLNLSSKESQNLDESVDPLPGQKSFLYQTTRNEAPPDRLYNQDIIYLSHTRRETENLPGSADLYTYLNIRITRNIESLQRITEPRRTNRSILFPDKSPRFRVTRKSSAYVCFREETPLSSLPFLSSLANKPA